MSSPEEASEASIRSKILRSKIFKQNDSEASILLVLVYLSSPYYCDYTDRFEFFVPISILLKAKWDVKWMSEFGTNFVAIKFSTPKNPEEPPKRSKRLAQPLCDLSHLNIYYINFLAVRRYDLRAF